MIDIHAHILPGLDDGPATLEESLAMLRVAADAGTTDIVATPHASLTFGFDEQRVAAKLAELRAASGPAPRIHSGCDFHLTFDNVQDALNHPGKYTINRRGYLLVELSDLMILKNIDDIFARLRLAGITPVITHPERNWLLQQRLDQLAGWVESGCALQITAQSLFGRFGGEAQTFARRLLERNLVHFIASDAHDAQDRTPRLDQAWRWLERRYGRRCAEVLLIENPSAALAGEAIQTPPMSRQGLFSRLLRAR